MSVLEIKPKMAPSLATGASDSIEMISEPQSQLEETFMTKPSIELRVKVWLP